MACKRCEYEQQIRRRGWRGEGGCASHRRLTKELAHLAFGSGGSGRTSRERSLPREHIEYAGLLSRHRRVCLFAWRGSGGGATRRGRLVVRRCPGARRPSTRDLGRRRALQRVRCFRGRIPLRVDELSCGSRRRLRALSGRWRTQHGPGAAAMKGCGEDSAGRGDRPWLRHDVDGGGGRRGGRAAE